jgi:hypothetical protein
MPSIVEFDMNVYVYVCVILLLCACVHVSPHLITSNTFVSGYSQLPF